MFSMYLCIFFSKLKILKKFDNKQLNQILILYKKLFLGCYYVIYFFDIIGYVGYGFDVC